MFDFLQESLNNYVGPYTPAEISGYMANLIQELESQRNSEEDVAKVQKWKKQFDDNVQARNIQSVPLSTLEKSGLLYNLKGICVEWKAKWSRDEALRNSFKEAVARHVKEDGGERVSRKISLAEYQALQADPAMTNDHRYCMDKYKWVHDEGAGTNPRTLKGSAPTHYAIWQVRGGTLAALASIALDEDIDSRPKKGNDPAVIIKTSREPGAYAIHEALLDLFNELCVVRMVASGELDAGNNIPKGARSGGRKK